MKKSFSFYRPLLGLLIMGSVLVSCKETRPMKSCTTFTEMADPTTDTLSDWSATAIGLNASFVSIDNKYSKSLMPEVVKTVSHQVTGWKGEKLSAQILLWTAEDIKQVEFEFGDFVSEGATLPADIAQARFMRYVMTDEFAGGCGHRKPEDFAMSLQADMLDNLECFDIDAKTARPVWITVDVPHTAQAGVYKTKLKLFARDQDTQEFEFSLEVQDQTLPSANEWKFHLDLWQHPSAVARAQNLELWSDAHFEAMRPLMKMLADAGQKVITTNVNKDPWNNQCYDAYEDMITWTKNADGTWTYNYEIFDKWVNFMMDLGVTRMINCYSIVPWNNELIYKDVVADSIVTVQADPGTAIFEELWGSFLPNFSQHLKEKGWLEITNMAMDERSPKDMEATMAMLKRVAPELGISLADNHKSYKKYPFIREISVAASAKVDLEDIATRREQGLVTTYYVCCSDKFPNVFTFSGHTEGVYAAWYAMAADFDGFLRWAYNSWVEKPMLDSRFITWPAGDTYIVYPEARSSVRFERLLEGIQDVEKVRVLRTKLAAEGTPEATAKLEKLNAEVAKFNTVEPEGSYVDMVNNAKNLVKELSK